MIETIKPGNPGFWRYVREIWPNRNLLKYFAIDSITSYYRDTIIGLPWFFLRPLAPALLFALIFGRIDSLQTPGTPYLLYVLSGLIMLQPVNFGLRRITRSINSYSEFVKKRYFPRIIIPLAYCVPVALQLVVGLLLLAIMTFVCIYFYELQVNLSFSYRLLYVPLALLLCMGFMTALGCLLTVLNSATDDVRLALPVFNMGLMFLTPVFYPLTLIDEGLRWAFLTFNPLVVAISVFRNGVFNTPLHFDPSYILIASGVCSLYILVAIVVFVRADPILADIT